MWKDGQWMESWNEEDLHRRPSSDYSALSGVERRLGDGDDVEGARPLALIHGKMRIQQYRQRQEVEVAEF